MPRTSQGQMSSFFMRLMTARLRSCGARNFGPTGPLAPTIRPYTIASCPMTASRANVTQDVNSMKALPNQAGSVTSEAEWLACADPGPMLAALGGRGTDRKLRLFGAACCRLVWEALPFDECRAAVE